MDFTTCLCLPSLPLLVSSQQCLYSLSFPEPCFFLLAGVTVTIPKGGVVSGGRSGQGGLSGKGGAGGTGIYIGPPPTPATTPSPPPAMDALTPSPLQQSSNPLPNELSRTWMCILGFVAVAGAMVATLALFYGCIRVVSIDCYLLWECECIRDNRKDYNHHFSFARSVRRQIHRHRSPIMLNSLKRDQ